MDTRRLGRAHVRAPGAHRPRRRPRVRRQPDRGLRTHVAEVAQRTGATVVVQLDEPGLPAVLAGSLPTASGYGTVRAIAAPDAQDLLRDLVDGVDAPVVVHCCADRPPIRLLAGTGAAAVGIDATRPAFAGGTAEPSALDAIGETWDSGVPLFLGLLPGTTPSREPAIGDLARAGYDLADRLGFDRPRLARLAVPTPACGLAGASPAWRSVRSPCPASWERPSPIRTRSRPPTGADPA